MSYRDRVLVMMLWLAIIGMGSWAGGPLYQMVEVVPVWSSSPPDSVRTFFRDTDFGRHNVRFFGPPTMLARNLSDSRCNSRVRLSDQRSPLQPSQRLG